MSLSKIKPIVVYNREVIELFSNKQGQNKFSSYSFIKVGSEIKIISYDREKDLIKQFSVDGILMKPGIVFNMKLSELLSKDRKDVLELLKNEASFK